MGATVADQSSTILCFHGGPVSIITSNQRVKVNGQPVVTMNDTYTVSGCPFTIPPPVGPKPQPCVRLQWVVAAQRVRVSGQPVLLMNSSGICLSAEQIPQGLPNIVVTQVRVRGT